MDGRLTIAIAEKLASPRCVFPASMPSANESSRMLPQRRIAQIIKSSSETTKTITNLA